MARADEILFCKIAIKNNLLSREDANASLKEIGDTGEARVGDLLEERGILTRDQVEMIYTAVEKLQARQGKGGGTTAASRFPTKAAPTVGRARPTPARAQTPRPARRERTAKREPARRAPRKPANPAVVIASGAAFVVVMAIFAIMAMKSREPKEKRPTPAAKERKSKAAPVTPLVKKEAPIVPPVMERTAEEMADLKRDFEGAQFDARREEMDGYPGKAIAIYDGFVRGHGNLPPEMLGQIAQARKEYEKTIGGWVKEAEKDVDVFLKEKQYERALERLAELDEAKVGSEEAKKIQARMKEIRDQAGAK